MDRAKQVFEIDGLARFTDDDLPVSIRHLTNQLEGSLLGMQPRCFLMMCVAFTCAVFNEGAASAAGADGSVRMPLQILRGGLGTPEGGFVIKWTHAKRCRNAFPKFETILEIIREQPCWLGRRSRCSSSQHGGGHAGAVAADEVPV